MRSQSLVLAAILTAAMQSQALFGVTFTVNSTADLQDLVAGDGSCATATNVCTFRAAVQEANALAGADIVDLPAGNYPLTLGSVGLGSNLSISGAGAATTALQGNGTATVLYDGVGGLVVSISGVRITGGAGQTGGGIFFGTGTLTLSDCVVAGNQAQNGGGLYLAGTLSMVRTTVSGNQAANGGGGIRLTAAASGTISDSTVSGNSVSSSGASGGGLEIQGTLSILNSTISGNMSPPSFGSALSSAGDLVTLDHVTVSGNSTQIQVVASGSGTFNLHTSIIAAPGAGINCAGAVASLGGNLDTGTSCGFGAGDLSNVAANLGPLADNGGPTQTHLPLAGSPAIDAVTGGCPPPATDQRGIARPVGTACDSGAVEAPAAAVVPAVPTLSSLGLLVLAALLSAGGALTLRWRGTR